MPMTPEELDAIELRAAAATPGPWAEDDGHIFSRPLTYERHAAIMRRMAGSPEPHPDGDRDAPLGAVATCSQDFPNFEADSEFIAAARSDVPALVAEVEALRSQLATATARAESGDVLAEAVRSYVEDDDEDRAESFDELVRLAKRHRERFPR